MQSGGTDQGVIAEADYTTAIVQLSGSTEPAKYYLTGNSWYFYDPIDYSVKLFSLNQGQIISDSIKYYPVLIIDSITSFSNVYEIKYIHDGSQYYINDSIGIVRKDLYQGNGVYKRYYLKKYHIVK
jgi:hypothetical protein